LAEVQDGGLLDRALEAEVELLERLAGGESRGLDAALSAVSVAAVGLGLEQRGGELLVAPVFVAGPLGQLGQRACRGGCFERAEQMRELAAGAHAINAS
jgi:hypothetical protein